MLRLGGSLLAGIFLMSMSAVAHADIAVRYQPPASGLPITMDMTVEVNDDGRIRVQMFPGPAYILIVDNTAYYVQRAPDGDYAIPMAAHIEMVAEQMAAVGFPDEAVPEAEEMELIPLGTVEIEGRTGTAYHFGNRQSRVQPEQAMFVISTDPAFAEVGRAMALATRLGSMRTPGNMLLQRMAYGQANIIRILETGMPLRFGPMILTDVATTSIDESRFALPATILSAEDMRRMVAPYDAAPTLPPLQPRQQSETPTPR